MYRLMCIFCFLSINCTAQHLVSAADALVQYNGRIGPISDHVRLEWPGTSVRLSFTGPELSVDLRDEHGKNRFNVLIDGKVTTILSPDSIRREYVLAKGLSQGKHTAELFKRTEAGMGGTLLFQFKLHAKDSLISTPKRERRMEFYGNSITCGMAIGDTLNNGVDENNFLAYGAVVARALDAEYSCIAKSGIGLMVSWFPEIMPEIYDRIYESDAKSQWDFKRYNPQVVVIDLGQNDSWITKQPENPQFKRRFGNNAPASGAIINAYVAFFKQLRSKYPQASIICTLGSMDATKPGSPWPGYLQSAVKELHDPLMYSFIFPYMLPAGKKDPHPGIREHQEMAGLLREFIHQTVGW